ncbi:MAG: hypothetical protein HKM95_05085, partial [Inquilinus sp.]|nr:hypothetical protein [Inquilinus sp.]
GSPHQVFVRHDLADMAAAMASADLAVSAAGSTLWELAFMGVPTLALVAAEGQRPAAAAYGAAGLGDVIDLLAADGEARLGPAIATLLGDAERRRTIAARGRAAVDGQGAARVCQRIEALLLKARAQA